MAVNHGVEGSSPSWASLNKKFASLIKPNLQVYRKLVLHFQLLKKGHDRCPSRGKSVAKHLSYGELVQLGEHLSCKQRVTGSNPVFSTLDYIFISFDIILIGDKLIISRALAKHKGRPSGLAVSARRYGNCHLLD